MGNSKFDHPFLIQFNCLIFQRDLREKINKLGSFTWGLLVRVYE